MTELQPCPFCGNDGSDPSFPLQVEAGVFGGWVCCKQCGALGPDGNSYKNLNAVEAWNQRDDLQNQLRRMTTND